MLQEPDAHATDMNRKAASEIITYPEMLHAPGSIGFVEKLLIGALLLIVQPRLIIETGMLKGYTTRFLAEFLEANDLTPCRIVTFDLPRAIARLLATNDYFVDHPLIETRPGRLPESLREFLKETSEPVDFAIVDAMHSFKAVSQELKLIHSKLVPGGYVFCHDYREEDSQYRGVVYAVDGFAARYGYDLLPLNPARRKGQEVVWGSALLRKPRQPRSALKRAYFRSGLAQVVNLGRALCGV